MPRAIEYGRDDGPDRQARQTHAAPHRLQPGACRHRSSGLAFQGLLARRHGQTPRSEGMFLTLRKPAGPDLTTDHDPPTTVTMGTRSPWSGSWSARPQARPWVSRELEPAHPGRHKPAADGRSEAFLPHGHRTRTPVRRRSPPRAAASLRSAAPEPAHRRSGNLGRTAQPLSAARLRTILDRLRSLAVQPPVRRCAIGRPITHGPQLTARGRPDHEPDHGS